MITDEQCKAVYEKHQQLFDAADELDMPWQTLYCRLKKNGIPICGNKSKWGSSRDRFAAKGEEKFLSLVPFAKDMNKESFQPKVDFTVGAVKVDVKASKPRLASGRYPSKRWAFSLKKQIEHADFYVLFCYDEKGEEVLRCYLIPRDMINGMHTISIPVNSAGKWDRFIVATEDLAGFFRNVD